MNKLVAAGAALLVATGVTAVTNNSPAPAQAASASSTSLRVGSFNIQSVSLDKTVGLQRPWRQRRATVVSQVMGERLDVLGIQEANPSKTFKSRLIDGANQYRDLQIGLNKAGGSYALTNVYPYNCVNSGTTYKCVYKNRHASHGDRILYNTRTLSLVNEGATRYKVQGPGADPRFAVWAVLRVKATGKEFLFVNTHLRAGAASTRRSQWYQMISRINAVANGRPVVSVGDFNIHKFDPLSTEMLPAMRRAGYGDVLNQSYEVNPVAYPRARNTVNGWFNTANHLSGDVRDFSYYKNRAKTGNNIDWVFATNSLRVDEWKVVVNWNPYTMRVRGTLPSDHNMVRATLTMPAS
jgi:endonuclease/exonuclease/phosphatase family metal-dependent hydrolase